MNLKKSLEIDNIDKNQVWIRGLIIDTLQKFVDEYPNDAELGRNLRNQVKDLEL